MKQKSASKSIDNTDTGGKTWNLEPILGGQTFESLLKLLKTKANAFTTYRKDLNSNITAARLLTVGHHKPYSSHV